MFHPLRHTGSAGLFALCLLCPATSVAQSTPLSELWREWATLAAAWRAERVVYLRDRATNRALRARRAEHRP